MQTRPFLELKILNFQQGAFFEMLSCYWNTRNDLIRTSLRVEIPEERKNQRQRQRERAPSHGREGSMQEDDPWVPCPVMSRIYHKILLLLPLRGKSSPRLMGSVNLCFCSRGPVEGTQTSKDEWERRKIGKYMEMNQMLPAILTCWSSDVLCLQLVNFLEARATIGDLLWHRLGHKYVHIPLNSW